MKATYNKGDLIAMILNTIRTGQTESILHLFTTDLPKKCRKASEAQVSGLKSWKFDSGCAIYKHEHRLPGVASWAFDVAASIGADTLRFRVLHFDMNKERHVYLVPTIKDWAGLKLPDVKLTPDESKLLLRLANDLTPPAHLECLALKCNHLAKETVEGNAAAWDSTLDQADLFTLLIKCPELADIVLGAIDIQLRALKRLPCAPWLIYNLIRAKDTNVNASVEGILRACAFSNELSPLGGGPIDLVVKDSESLRQLQRSPGRFIFFYFREREQLQPMLKAVEERERIAKSGGGINGLGYPVATAMSGVFLGKPYALDCQLPDTLPALTGGELSLLRTAVKLGLTKQVAVETYRWWKAILTNPTNYAVNGALAWRYALAAVVSEKWFNDQTRREEFRKRYLAHLGKESAVQADRERILRNSLHRLADVDAYRDQIIEKPASVEEAKARLTDDAVAFRHTPLKGAQKGKELLVCDKGSLLRLLKPTGLTPDLYSTLCGRCEEEGLLLKRDYPITLQGGSFHAVAFDCAKLAAYQG